MNQLESALLDELTDGAEPKLLLRSRTRIDAGRWWRSTSVWICITGSELILFAVARRRYVERVPLTECHVCHYLAATGELVIESAEALRMKRVNLTPREAINVINFLTNN
ncbi:MAG: hypothetical protein V4727_13510 [Verrucomicrobiota bacterium]